MPLHTYEHQVSTFGVEYVPIQLNFDNGKQVYDCITVLYDPGYIPVLGLTWDLTYDNPCASALHINPWKVSNREQTIRYTTITDKTCYDRIETWGLETVCYTPAGRNALRAAINTNAYCDAIQSGRAIANIQIGPSPVLLHVEFDGLGESVYGVAGNVPRYDYERIDFSLSAIDSVESYRVAYAASTGSVNPNPIGDPGWVDPDSGGYPYRNCDPIPVYREHIDNTPYGIHPYRLEAGSRHTLLIEFTTKDVVYNNGCFYEINVYFEAIRK